VGLERTADLFTARLEYERKQGLLLTEQIRLLEEQVRGKKEATRTIVNADNPEERRLRHQIASLEHQIHLISSLTASTQTANFTLKSRIDSYRREHHTYHHAISTLTEDLTSVKTRCEVHEDQRTRVADATADLQARFEQLRSKSAQQQYRQRTRITELTVSDRQAVVKEDLENRSGYFKTLTDNVKYVIFRTLETLDPTPVQQALLQKWRLVNAP
jgi:chromosome segregation ATPase